MSTKNIKIIGIQLQGTIEKNPSRSRLGNHTRMVTIMEDLSRIDLLMAYLVKDLNQVDPNMRDTKWILGTTPILTHTTDGRGVQLKPITDLNH